jgi:hypothetical protein
MGAGGFAVPGPAKSTTRSAVPSAGVALTSHGAVGSVPEMNTSVRLVRRASESACGSAHTFAVSTPGGGENILTSWYGRIFAARFMNSAQMGSADFAPSRFYSRLSSNPTHTTHSNSLVKPANHPSCEVPVFPAAGKVNPCDRMPAPVPLRNTSCIRLTIR